MVEPKFVTQQQLETGIDRGEVTFNNDILTLVSRGISYRMSPAVKVTSLLDGDDVHGLLNGVWTVKELEALGAESFHDSVIAGDTAYQCEPGFVGHERVVPAPPPLPTEVKSAKQSVILPPEATPKPRSEGMASAAAVADVLPTAETTVESDDMTLLTDFFLKHM